MKPGFRELLLWFSLGLNVALIGGLAYVTSQPRTSHVRVRGPMGAPMPPPFPPELADVAKRLDLTPEQEQQMEQIFDGASGEVIANIDEMKAMRLRIIRHVVAHPEDEAGLQLVLAEGQGIPMRFANTMLSHLRQMVLILTAEQRAKLLKEFEEMDQRDLLIIRRLDGSDGPMEPRRTRP